jgi:polyisoprenoid-binding protein YceI
MAAEIEGTIPGWTADIRYDEASRAGRVAVTMPLSGMTLGAVTQQAAGPEFFDIARFPTATFTADIVDANGQLQARGTLALRGKGVPVTLPFALVIKDDIATMSAEVTVDRRDFGMGPSFPDESTVGFPVRIRVTLTARRQ